MDVQPVADAAIEAEDAIGLVDLVAVRIGPADDCRERAGLGRLRRGCDHEHVPVLLGEIPAVVAAEVHEAQALGRRRGVWPQHHVITVGMVDVRPAVDMQRARRAPPVGTEPVMGLPDRRGGDEADIMDFDMRARMLTADIDGEEFHAAALRARASSAASASAMRARSLPTISPISCELVIPWMNG